MALIVRGVDIAPAVGLGVRALLSDAAAALYPQTLTECLGTLAEAELVRRARAREPPAPGRRQRARDRGARAARRPRGPEDPHPGAVQQGTADRPCSRRSPTRWSRTTSRRGNQVTYKTYEGVDHGGSVETRRRPPTPRSTSARASGRVRRSEACSGLGPSADAVVARRGVPLCRDRLPGLPRAVRRRAGDRLRARGRAGAAAARPRRARARRARATPRSACPTARARSRASSRPG